VEELSPLDKVEALLEVTSHVNKWEEDFLNNIHERLTEGGSLSEARGSKLEEIYERVIASEPED